MRVIIQRSKNSSVKVAAKVVGQITKGYVLLVSFTESDNEQTLLKMAKKILNIRLFDDENGVMNKNISEVKGEILSISQFTLYADTTKGNRPSYMKALNSKKATILYDRFNEILREYLPVKTGIFGADMEVNIINDGPITIALEI